MSVNQILEGVLSFSLSHILELLANHAGFIFKIQFSQFKNLYSKLHCRLVLISDVIVSQYFCYSTNNKMDFFFDPIAKQTIFCILKTF